jgi:hypothetical protein
MMRILHLMKAKHISKDTEQDGGSYYGHKNDEFLPDVSLSDPLSLPK